MNLTKEFIDKTKSLETPFLAIEPEIIKMKYHQVVGLFDFAKVFYAIKANYDKKILGILNDMQSSFEVGSIGELNKLKRFNITPDRIISSNTLKEPRFIEEAYEYGIRQFAYDSTEEIDKLVKYAPKCKACLRLEVSNKGSDWPLTGKFGVPKEDASKLISYASKKNLNTNGLLFHVGSQSLNENSWVSALQCCKEVIEENGNRASIELINLGGGLPVHNTKEIPSYERIASIIRQYIAENFSKSMNFYMEPGRGLVGDSGIIVATVIAKAKRGNQTWLSLDIGAFNGLVDCLGGFEWEIITEKVEKKNLSPYIIAGPSCDSADKVAEDVWLPDLGVGDRVYLLNAAAYTTVYASDFDGFRKPKVTLI